MAHADNVGSTDAESLQTAVSDGADGNGSSSLASEQLEAVAAPARALVRERPYVALAGAVLAGFLVSRILRRG